FQQSVAPSLPFFTARLRRVVKPAALGREETAGGGEVPPAERPGIAGGDPPSGIQEIRVAMVGNNSQQQPISAMNPAAFATTPALVRRPCAHDALRRLAGECAGLA
ncbi:hypothetical protein V3330_08300, partial [Wenzhouxiangellaceae bacterium CH-27]